jgi:hypothetical protein
MGGATLATGMFLSPQVNSMCSELELTIPLRHRCFCFWDFTGSILFSLFQRVSRRVTWGMGLKMSAGKFADGTGLEEGFEGGGFGFVCEGGIGF